MLLTHKNENSVIILYHSICDTKLEMGNNRIIFCPKCQFAETPELDNLITHILCCAECKKPLSVTKGRGSYCLNCNFHPSMQDTFLSELA